MNHLICIAHLTNDRIITPQKTIEMTGGVAYYVSLAIAHLPHLINYSLVTKVAKRDFDKVNALEQEGVHVLCTESTDTVYFENIYDSNTNNRQQRVLSHADPFSISDIGDLLPPNEESKNTIVHLGPLLPNDFTPDFLKAIKPHATISLDAQGFLRDVINNQVRPRQWTNKAEYLRYTDIINVNEQEMNALTGAIDPVKGSEIIAQYGPKEVIITLGNKGSLIRSNGECIAIPAYTPPNKIVDATGCGDTYMAGYLYCRTLGMPIEPAGNCAAAMCALKLTQHGPFNAPLDSLKRLLNPEKT